MMDCSRLLNCFCSFLIKNLNNKVPRVGTFTKGRERIFQLWVLMNVILISTVPPDLITSLSKSNLSERAVFPGVQRPKVKPPHELPVQTCWNLLDVGCECALFHPCCILLACLFSLPSWCPSTPFQLWLYCLSGWNVPRSDGWQLAIWLVHSGSHCNQC